MNTPQPPQPTNPGIVSAQQTQSNQTTAESQAALNNVSQSNPFGSINYQGGNIDPTTGLPTSYSVNTQLTPQEQQLFNTYGQTQQTAGQTGQQILNNWSQKYGGNSNPFDPSAAVGQAAAMEQQYLNPYFRQQNSQLTNQLAQQGFAPGTQAYNDALNNLNNQQGNLVAGNIAQFEPLAFNQAVQSYETPLQTAQGLSSFGAPSLPGSAGVNTPQTGVSPTNVVGAYNNYQQAQEAAYQAQIAQQSAMLGGLFSIPAAIGGGWAKAGFPGLSNPFG